MTRYFTEDHEWVEVDNNTAKIGITAHAAEQLGEVVYIELKDVGTDFDKGDEIGVIESVKAASDIYAPVSGSVVEANTDIADNPGSLNEDPEGSGWLYRISISDASQLDGLMSKDAYNELVG